VESKKLKIQWCSQEAEKNRREGRMGKRLDSINKLWHVIAQYGSYRQLSYAVYLKNLEKEV
jgi:hypothetical protein